MSAEVLIEKWPIPTEFPITIASEEPAKYVFYTVVGKSGCKYYIPDNSDHPGDNIYVTETDDWDTPGRGFGGRTLTMNCCTKGDTSSNPDGYTGWQEQLKGGWHSNAEALYQETGIDIRDKHKTFVVIAKTRDAEFLYDVLYHDEEPKISDFRRGEALAKEFANKLGTPVVSFSRSTGGAVIGMVFP